MSEVLSQSLPGGFGAWGGCMAWSLRCPRVRWGAFDCRGAVVRRVVTAG
jgi:hypothetical protein